MNKCIFAEKRYVVTDLKIHLLLTFCIKTVRRKYNNIYPKSETYPGHTFGWENAHPLENSDLIASPVNVQGNPYAIYCKTIGIPSNGQITPEIKTFGKNSAMASKAASISSLQREPIKRPIVTPPNPLIMNRIITSIKFPRTSICINTVKLKYTSKDWRTRTMHSVHE